MKFNKTIPYDQVLPRAQRLFSLKSVLRNGIPTLKYHLQNVTLKPSDTITFFIPNIFPPNIILWRYLAQKYFGDAVEIVVFDCSGNLDPAEVPRIQVQRYMNAMHPTKIDAFLKRMANKRRYVWICDDDVFPLSPTALQVLHEEFSEPRTATVSFRPRTWWHFEINNKTYEPSGSYCIALDRELIVEKEHLNAQPADGNTHHSHITKPVRRYDTLDKANEELLMRGYRCAIVPKEKRDACFAGFDGTSIAALLLKYFSTSKQVLAYFDNATNDELRGNVLFRSLAALLSAQAVIEICATCLGKQYDYPSLPQPEELQRIRKRMEPLLQDGRNFEGIDATAALLREKI